MARILLGKRKGQIVKIHQFANDWIMLEDGKIVSPTSLQYTDQERDIICADKVGLFWSLYEFVPTKDGYKIKKVK